MKTSAKILIIINLISLFSCSTIPKTICPENQYKSLKNIPIYLTTKDTINLFSSNNSKNISTDGKLNSMLIKNYQIDSSSINAEIAKYETKIAFSKIEKIEFDGIYDKNKGIIPESELKDNMGHRRTFCRILFGVAGLFS